MCFGLVPKNQNFPRALMQESINQCLRTVDFFLKKIMAQNSASFVYFRPFLNTMTYTYSTKLDTKWNNRRLCAVNLNSYSMIFKSVNWYSVISYDVIPLFNFLLDCFRAFSGISKLTSFTKGERVKRMKQHIHLE